MEMKNYLVEELSNREKAYLKALVINKAKEFLRKNWRDLKGEVINFSDSIEVNYTLNINDLFSAVEETAYGIDDFEKIASSKELYYLLKALSKKEKTVLFLFCTKKKSINEIAYEMERSRETVWRNEKKTTNKLARKLKKGK